MILFVFLHTMNSFTFIDLFCGIGGFHQAMTQLGGHCVFASDIDIECQKTYAANYGIVPRGDITKIKAEEIPSHDVLCAGFPCQSFSKAGNRLGFADETKGTLFFDVLRIIRHHQPKYALLENVRNLASHDNGNTWRVIRESLRSIGYDVLEEPVIFSPHYLGIPQHRERVYIMCVRKDVGNLPKFHFNDSILPNCNIEEILQSEDEICNISKYRLSTDKMELINIWEEFIQGIDAKNLPGFPVWSECLCSMDEICKKVNVEEQPRWAQNFICKNSELWSQNREFIDKWLMRARTCRLFFGSKAKLEWQAGKTSHPSIWNNIIQIRPSGIRVKPCTYFPALVAITQTSIVGSRRRFLTPRECARLQSFPDSFICNPKDAQAYKQFGNSVNVELIKLFANYMFGDIPTRQKYSLDYQSPPQIRKLDTQLSFDMDFKSAIG